MNTGNYNEALSAVNKIAQDQKNRLLKRRLNMYSLLDKPTRKQVKYIGDKLKFMFKNDVYGQLNADIQVFQLNSKSSLTLDIIQNQVLKNGQKAASKGLSIEQFLKIIEEEFLASKGDD